MPPAHRSQKLGPGELLIGETGTELDLSAQMTAVTIVWENDEGDAVNVLSGESLPGDDNFSASLEGTVMQDMSAAGVIDWTWSNKGRVVPIVFRPTGDTAKVAGRVKVLPVDLGGEVNIKNTSDLTWTFVGEPTFTPITDDVGGGAE